MKRAVVTAVVLSTLMASGLGSCQGGSAAQDPEGYVDGAVEDIKKVFSEEVSAFFESDDLSKSLGIDSSSRARIEESIKTYINDYSMDEEKLSGAKESLDELLENAEGLSVEEIQDRISGIFADK